MLFFLYEFYKGFRLVSIVGCKLSAICKKKAVKKIKDEVEQINQKFELYVAKKASEKEHKLKLLEQQKTLMATLESQR